MGQVLSGGRGIPQPESEEGRFNDAAILRQEERVRSYETTASSSVLFTGQLNEEKKKLKKMKEFSESLSSTPGVRNQTQTSALVAGAGSVTPTLSELV